MRPKFSGDLVAGTALAYALLACALLAYALYAFDELGGACQLSGSANDADVRPTTTAKAIVSLLNMI